MERDIRRGDIAFPACEGNPSACLLYTYALFEANLDNLPYTAEGLMSALNRDGWAVVSNPDARDRLHLRTHPKKGAQSLGKFYNGTPVRVLEEPVSYTHLALH